MSLSSRVRGGLPGVPAAAPFRRLYCVNRIFIVASRTSDKLCLICESNRTQWRECHVHKGSFWSLKIIAFQNYTD